MSFRRLRPGRIPDPMQAHGAWVYLLVSALAGALCAARTGLLPALAGALFFVGAFLVAAALSARRLLAGLGRALCGMVLAGLSLLLAARFGASPRGLAIALVALPPAAISGFFAERRGFQSEAALGFAVAALAVAAPTSACAGGVSLADGLLLVALLAPFFVWRALRVRRLLAAGITRSALRRQGFREAALALTWTLIVVGFAHTRH